MVERQKPPMMGLETKALRIDHSLNRVRDFINQPVGIDPWPKRFNLDSNLTGESFLQQAVEVGQKASAIKGHLRENALPILASKKLEIDHLIRVAKSEELVRKIADLVRKGILTPKTLAKAEGELRNIRGNNTSSASQVQPATESKPESTALESVPDNNPIYQEPARETFKLPDEQVIALKGYLEKPLLEILIEMLGKGQPARLEDLLTVIPKQLANRRQVIAVNIHRLREELAPRGWEIANLNARRQPGAYVFRKQHAGNAKALPSEMPNQSSSVPDFLVGPSGETYPQKGGEGLTFQFGDKTITLPNKDLYETGDVTTATGIDNPTILKNKILLAIDHDPTIIVQLQSSMPENKLFFKKEDFQRLIEAIQTKKWETNLDPSKNWFKLPDNEVIRVKDALDKQLMEILIMARAERRYALTSWMIAILQKGRPEGDKQIEKANRLIFLRKELAPYGWFIDVFIDPHERFNHGQGKYWLRKNDEPSLKELIQRNELGPGEEEAQNSPSAQTATDASKQIVRLEQNGTGQGEEPHPLLNSAMSARAEERRRQQLEEAERQLQKDITLVILSNIKNGNLANITRRPNEFLATAINRASNHLTLQSLATSEEELKQFIISGLSETLELWMKETNLRTAPEREKDLRRWFAEFRNQGHTVKELVEIVCNHFDIETPEKYRQSSTSSPVTVFPKV